MRARRAHILIVCAGVTLSVAALLGGCATSWFGRTDDGARSTRLTGADLAEAGDAVAQQLADAEFLRGRTPDSEPIRLVARQLDNLSSDRIPIAEQWMAISRVLSDRGVQELFRTRSVVVQLPPERVEMLSDAGFEFPALRPEDRPTHELRAEIRSATRAGSSTGDRGADVRKDVYLVTYSIVDLEQRTLVWEGSSEVAREAFGLTLD